MERDTSASPSLTYQIPSLHPYNYTSTLFSRTSTQRSQMTTYTFTKTERHPQHLQRNDGVLVHQNNFYQWQEVEPLIHNGNLERTDFVLTKIGQSMKYCVDGTKLRCVIYVSSHVHLVTRIRSLTMFFACRKVASKPRVNSQLVAQQRVLSFLKLEPGRSLIGKEVSSQLPDLIDKTAVGTERRWHTLCLEPEDPNTRQRSILVVSLAAGTWNRITGYSKSWVLDPHFGKSAPTCKALTNYAE